MKKITYKDVLRWLLAVIGIVAFVGTALSLSDSDYWAIRVVDLVSRPLLIMCVVLGIVAALTLHKWRWFVITCFVLAAAVHLWRIWPYSPLASTEVEFIADASDDRCVTAMAANVKQDNRDFQSVIDQIEEVDPDLLLLMETDDDWAEALSDVLAKYPSTPAEIQENTYGLIFASRLDIPRHDIMEMTPENTPMLYATIAMPNGKQFDYVALHPKPPLPGQNTTYRDKEILKAAEMTAERDADALVMGDFNDVPWSLVTSEFREVGSWRDPRIGRGTYPTFPGGAMNMLGYPLDQVMIRGDLQLRSFEVLPDNGSDHRAMTATVCLG